MPMLFLASKAILEHEKKWCWKSRRFRFPDLRGRKEFRNTSARSAASFLPLIGATFIFPSRDFNACSTLLLVFFFPLDSLSFLFLMVPKMNGSLRARERVLVCVVSFTIIWREREKREPSSYGVDRFRSFYVLKTHICSLVMTPCAIIWRSTS